MDFKTKKSQVLLVGSSHAEVIFRAYTSRDRSSWFDMQTMLLHDPRYNPWSSWTDDELSVNPILLNDILETIRSKRVCHVTMMIGGSSYFGLSGVNSPRLFDFIIPGHEDLPLAAGAEIIPYDLVCNFFYREEINILKPLFFAQSLPVEVSCLSAPPPVRDPIKFLENVPQDWHENIRKLGVPDPSFRYKTWLAYTSVVRKICQARNIEMIEPPECAMDESGFLLESFRHDAIHGNAAYGEAVLEQIKSRVSQREFIVT